MKIKFNLEEKRLVMKQLEQMAIQAAQSGDEKLAKELIRVGNHFTPNAVYSQIHRYEAIMLNEVFNGVKKSLADDILPGLQEKPEENKEKLERTNELLTISGSILEKLNGKLATK